ncbi:formyltransferase family protein [Shewanella frigidimarina]|uniref:formyltransferase family protein n=1 Tax=Shewanella frigidimarina TaxID=56812 RepID=UPI003D7B2A63
MKLGFVTCVQLGLSCMEAIYDAGGKLQVAITLKDEKAKSKSGRVFLDKFCQSKSIELVKIDHINDDNVIDVIKKYDLDWLFIIGWSQIAKKRLLDTPKLGVLGMHPTLLPKGRGRASIPWAIIKGLDETGVTLFKLDEGVDTGAILSQHKIPLNDSTTSTELYQLVSDAHSNLMKSIIPNILSGNVNLQEQDNAAATVWEGRTPKDGEIDLKDSIVNAERLVRATTKPYPGAFVMREGKKYIIWKAQVVKKYTDGLCLEFKDGFLECLEWEVE